MAKPALIVIDVQRGFDDRAFWDVPGSVDLPRHNPDCEVNVLALLRRWRERGWPVVLVRHDSRHAGSPLATGSPGNAFKEGIDGPHDLLVTKHVNSAFHGDPDLDAWLRDGGIDTIVVCGITTNHCCETTARVGGNLGYDVRFVLDATHTFDRAALDGTTIPAAELARVTAANLHGEFATVVSTRDVLGEDG